MIAAMIVLVMWLFVIGVSPADSKPGKLRIFLTLVFGFTLAVSGFLTFAFATEWGSHLAAINMMLFGVACLQYTFRTIALYSVARESVVPVLENHDTDAFQDGSMPWSTPGLYLFSPLNRDHD